MLNKLLLTLHCAFLEANITCELSSTTLGEVQSFLNKIKQDYQPDYRLQFLKLTNQIMLELEDSRNYTYTYGGTNDSTQTVTVIGEFTAVVDVSSEQESGKSRADNMRWNLRQLLGMLNLPYETISVVKRPTSKGVAFRAILTRGYTR